MTVNMNLYSTFVEKLTSMPSTDFDSYIASLVRLKDSGCNISKLDTAVTGLSAESNEALEIVKKLKFQGKEWTPDVHFHLLREAGDMIFYWMMLCQALNVNYSDIIQENVKKLESRYPGGTFSVVNSEVRKENDI